MYEIYQRLLDEKGLKNADVSRATGISNMTLSDWKHGKTTPKHDKLKKIAEYLGVTVNYLLTGEDEPEQPVYYFNSETAAMAQKLFERKELRILFDAAQDASADDLRITANLLEELKKKERGEDDF